MLYEIYIWSPPLELGYFRPSPMLHHGLSNLEWSWAASSLTRSVLTCVNSHGFTEKSPGCYPWQWLYEIIICCSGAVPPQPPSHILSAVGNTRTEKTRGPHRAPPLRWSWDKRWPNWDSRHHLCESCMFFWKVATETIFAFETSRAWILVPKRNHLRMMVWMGLKPDGEFSYKGSVLPGVQIKDHTS